MNVIESEFSARDGRSIHLWAVYYGDCVFTLSYAVSPAWIMETVNFNVARRVA